MGSYRTGRTGHDLGLTLSRSLAYSLLDEIFNRIEDLGHELRPYWILIVIAVSR